MKHFKLFRGHLTRNQRRVPLPIQYLVLVLLHDPRQNGQVDGMHGQEQPWSKHRCKLSTA
jgi:hypothetical protein